MKHHNYRYLARCTAEHRSKKRGSEQKKNRATLENGINHPQDSLVLNFKENRGSRKSPYGCPAFQPGEAKTMQSRDFGVQHVNVKRQLSLTAELRKGSTQCSMRCSYLSTKRKVTSG